MDTIDLFRRALMATVLLSTPALVVATLLGVGISLVQSLFQIQDQTASFAAKLVSITAILLMTGSWMLGELVQITNNAFALMGEVGR